MSKHTLFRLSVLLLLVTCLFLGGCTTPEKDDGSPVLKVGVAANMPPIIYKQGGNYAGLEAEFARRLANRLKARLRFVDMPFDRLLPALDADKIDIIMSGMTVTSLREPLAQFCEPYATTGQALLVRPADLWTFAYPEVIYLVKTRIGVEKGTIADALARRRCPNATVVSFPSPEAAAQALKANQVDVVIADAPVVWRLGAEAQGEGITPVRKLLTRENLAWAVARGDTEMLNAGNAAIRQWRADGTLASLIRSYLPMSGQ